MDGVIVIAVDGPVAAGKGTLARHLATRTGLRHLDSGMIYRAVAALVLEAGDDAGNAQACRQRAERLVAADLERPGLRDQEIGSVSSRIAAHREVRAALVEFQRRFGATPPGAVIDGRDIGTVVFPDADLKFFVTAHVRARAKRRHRELVSRGATIDFHSVLHEISERDRRDSERTWAPLRQADDAVVIDTTALDARAVAEKALDIVRQRLGAASVLS
ncbi:MAG: (d)CMP kinase [Alphaproteobacteria bacterium]|nr:(d)CMP kinase [Alphaproteobacteria bacterium]